jgi:quinoprotein glucose dehydrogenase
MNTGEHVWQVPNGDGVNDHPLLRDLDLPPLGTPSRPSALVTRSLLFIGEGSDAFGGVDFWGRTFRAYDKATGAVVWETELPGGTTSQPMSYMYDGRQYIVVPVGDSEHPAEFVALALP